MQRNFDALTPPAAIQIVVVNEIGAESATNSILAGRSLPFVQDNTTARVWRSWGAALRSLWIVDAQGRRVDVIDITTRPLTDPSNATAVQTRLLQVAGR